MDIQQFLIEAAEALGAESQVAFIEKWIPQIVNTVNSLRQEKALIELDLDAARSELEG